MKKNLFLGMTLGMALLANTAFAHLSGGYLSDIIDEHPRWPLPTQCIATDVNLRTEPNTNCEVVTMLQNGDKFYARKVVFIPRLCSRLRLQHGQSRACRRYEYCL